jgi:hypothetical protein
MLEKNILYAWNSLIKRVNIIGDAVDDVDDEVLLLTFDNVVG